MGAGRFGPDQRRRERRNRRAPDRRSRHEPERRDDHGHPELRGERSRSDRVDGRPLHRRGCHLLGQRAGAAHGDDALDGPVAQWSPVALGIYLQQLRPRSAQRKRPVPAHRHRGHAGGRTGRVRVRRQRERGRSGHLGDGALPRRRADGKRRRGLRARSSGAGRARRRRPPGVHGRSDRAEQGLQREPHVYQPRCTVLGPPLLTGHGSHRRAPRRPLTARASA